ncbi:VOC family protein [Pseudolysinimonas sp.]|uniref:VOC family protein n=1 Tax=Pseudolysinimonas sp. TaxID=2680009 RepID=UPI003F8129BA
MAVTDVTPFIWYDDDLAEALDSYERIFGDLHRRPDLLDPATGRLLGAWFEVGGRRVIGLQGGPGHPHTDALSLYVTLDGGQEEVDRIWDGFLAEGGNEVACGWLTDRFGVSWQIVPVELEEAILSTDEERRAYAYAAMMDMTKIVIADLVPSA